MYYYHFFIRLGHLSLRFQIVDQQEPIQSSGREDTAWSSRDKITHLLEHTIL